MRRVLAALFVGAAFGLAVITIIGDPSLLRWGLLAVIVCAFALTSLIKPRFVILATLCFLPFTGLIRRLLIPSSGWTSWDGLLLVSSVACLFMAHRLFIIERRRLAKDAFSKFLLGFLLLAVIESINPMGGSLLAGITGLLFLPAPLAWFFIGRELADNRLVNTALGATVVLGVLGAAYGLWQTTAGFPAWDQTWINLNFSNGYTALGVSGSIRAANAIRAFGTFSSSAEYATFLGVAFVIAFTRLLHGRLLALPALPIIGLALFLDASRGVVVLTLVAVAIAIGLRTGSLALTALSTLLVAGFVLGTIYVYGPQLMELAGQSGSPFIEHQAVGLLNPFDPNASTLQAHQQIVSNGIAGSFNHPLGLGLAAINPHGGRLAAATSAGTEADISNVFVSIGPLGGALFLLLIVVTFLRAGRLALKGKDVTSRVVFAVLVVTLGQWLNGSYYSVAPLVWLLVGWLTFAWAAQPARISAAARLRQRVASQAWPAAATSA